MNLIKIYGLRRTGTNYMQWLLAHNFSNMVVLINIPEWKHGIPSTVNRECLNNTGYLGLDYMLSADLSDFPTLRDTCDAPLNYILCVKDPYSWYLSICNWRNIDPFPLDKDKLEQLFLWNYMGNEYRKFINSNPLCAAIVKYEDAFSSLEYLNSAFQLERSSFTDCMVNVYTGEDFSFSRKYYTDRLYLAKYSEADFVFMNKFLDPRVVGHLGYRLE